MNANERAEIDALKAELAAVRTEVNDLRRFQSWLTGALAGFGVLMAFIADGIRKKLGFAD